jgi:peptidyl-prolyl cis-trans isomerase A (cyclophilin A)
MKHRWALLVSILCALAACGGTTPAERPSPAEYKVKLATTKGDVVILVHRDWAPLGADHFYNLVKRGYYDNNAFFRALKGYIVQWGINGDPKVYTRWDKVKIKDDPPKVSNKTGTVVFATPSDPNGRTTHIFINIHDNGENLDSRGFVPFGEVIQGLENIMNVYMDYGEGAPEGQGPDQEAAGNGGNAYLKKNFPKLDYILKATIVP